MLLSIVTACCTPAQPRAAPLLQPLRPSSARGGAHEQFNTAPLRCPPLYPTAAACYAPAQPHTTPLRHSTLPPLRRRLPRPCTAPHSALAQSCATPQRGHMLRSRACACGDPAQPESAPLAQPHTVPLLQPLHPGAAPRCPLRRSVLRPRAALSCAHARPQAPRCAHA